MFGNHRIQKPGFTAVAVLALALGIGGNTAILLVFVALLDCFVPARRAAKENPIIALRGE